MIGAIALFVFIVVVIFCLYKRANPDSELFRYKAIEDDDRIN